MELYEGVLKEEADIRAFLQRAVAVTRELLAAGRFGRSPAVLSGAGSAWYDVVAEEFAAAGTGNAVDLVLRPGCYLTHDVGVYRAAQERILAANPVARRMREGLLPALQVWAYVQSMPEPDLAIIGMGKRCRLRRRHADPRTALSSGTAAPVEAPSHWAVTGMMDQHAYLRLQPGDDLRVGDMIAFDISHPCLTFDKWRHIPVLDDRLRVVDVVQTFF